MKRLLIPIFLGIFATVFSIGFRFAVVRAANDGWVPIQNVQTGNAILRQQGRLTVLELKPRNGAARRIALTHPTDFRQGTNAPYEGQLIEESPDNFLIFTDTFDSNPANVQGHCGASSGERFLHVVALGGIPHETLSVLIESCLLDLVPTSHSPEWVAKRDSAGFIGKIVITFESDMSPSLVYWVAPDGSVSRPEIGRLKDSRR